MGRFKDCEQFGGVRLEQLPQEFRAPGIKLHEPIGRGGFATVFSGTFETPNGNPLRAAIKVANTPGLHLEPPWSLHNEAIVGQAVRQTASPERFVQVIGERIGEFPDGLHEIVVEELLHDGTMADQLRRGGPLSPTKVLKYAGQAAEGLDAMHRLGLLHRDIKPSNFLLDGARRRVKICDFGIAQTTIPGKGVQVGEQTTATLDPDPKDYALGSPDYMAPEQARGGEVDGTIDIRALAVVVFEAATLKHFIPEDRVTPLPRKLKRLVDPETYAEMVGHARLALVDAGLGAWETPIARATSGDPAKRPDDAQVLVDDLEGRWNDELADREKAARGGSGRRRYFVPPAAAA